MQHPSQEPSRSPAPCVQGPVLFRSWSALQPLRLLCERGACVCVCVCVCVPGIPPQLSGSGPAVSACRLPALRHHFHPFLPSWPLCPVDLYAGLSRDKTHTTQPDATPACQHIPTTTTQVPGARCQATLIQCAPSPSPPPCEKPPCTREPPRHPGAGPPLSAESSTRLPESLPIWGRPCPASPAPYPGVACPIGLVLLVRPCLALIAWPPSPS